MTDTNVTYERTMTIEYEREDGLSDKKASKLQYLLACVGLFLVPAYRNSKPDFDDYEEYEKTTTEKTYRLVDDNDDNALVNDFGAVSNSTVAGYIRLTLERINDHLKSDIQLEVTTVDSKIWMFPRWKGSYLWPTTSGRFNFCAVVGDYINHAHGVYDDETETANQTKMATSLLYHSYDKTMKLSFRIWKECETMQNKTDIERWLVDTPLDDMALIQARVEECLDSVGFNVADPTIDCHFDAKTESRSECTPDIIGRLRDAKQAARSA